MNAPVLGARCTMKVDDHLQSVVLCPAYSLAEVGKLTLHVWLVALNVPSPEADGQTDMVETNEDDQHNEIGKIERETHPAAAMSEKSCSVIQLSQCARSFDVATDLDWYWQNVHSSTMASFPVSSNKLGVIQGCGLSSGPGA